MSSAAALAEDEESSSTSWQHPMMDRPLGPSTSKSFAWHGRHSISTKPDGTALATSSEQFGVTSSTDVDATTLAGKEGPPRTYKLEDLIELLDAGYHLFVCGPMKAGKSLLAKSVADYYRNGRVVSTIMPGAAGLPGGERTTVVLSPPGSPSSSAQGKRTSTGSSSEVLVVTYTAAADTRPPAPFWERPDEFRGTKGENKRWVTLKDSCCDETYDEHKLVSHFPQNGSTYFDSREGVRQVVVLIDEAHLIDSLSDRLEGIIAGLMRRGRQTERAQTVGGKQTQPDGREEASPGGAPLQNQIKTAQQEQHLLKNGDTSLVVPQQGASVETSDIKQLPTITFVLCGIRLKMGAAWLPAPDDFFGSAVRIPKMAGVATLVLCAKCEKCGGELVGTAGTNANVVGGPSPRSVGFGFDVNSIHNDLVRDGKFKFEPEELIGGHDCYTNLCWACWAKLRARHGNREVMVRGR